MKSEAFNVVRDQAQVSLTLFSNSGEALSRRLEPNEARALATKLTLAADGAEKHAAIEAEARAAEAAARRAVCLKHGIPV